MRVCKQEGWMVYLGYVCTECIIVYVRMYTYAYMRI